MMPRPQPSRTPGRPASSTERPEWQATDPGAVRCEAYTEHRAEHRRYQGAWRCWRCWPIGGRA
jgi:hypothetical protein